MPAEREEARLDDGPFRFGTCSWTAKGWVGSFYPKGTKPADFLEHYGRAFSTLEADNTYYRVPAPDVVRQWAVRTPADFLWSAKFPRSIVHAGEGAQPDGSAVLVARHCEADAVAFVDAMGELGGKCGSLLLQFPYFNRKAFPGPEPFLERLDRFLDWLPDRFHYAVEIRNKSWVGEALLDVLRRHGASFVLLDLAYMPHPDEFWERLPLVTSDRVYVRLIGDRKAVDAKTKSFDRIVVDRSDRLDRWARTLELLRGAAPQVYVYANNHFAGYAPETLRALASRLR